MTGFDPFELFIRLVPMMLGAGVVMVGLELLSQKIDREIKQRRGETTAERISRLSKSLKESIELTNEIEKEIQERHSLANKLQEDVERFEQLSKLKGSEVEAITQTLRGELRTEGNKSLLKSVLISMFFFVAGVLVTLFTA